MGFFSKLKEGLSKTKNSFNEKMNNVFSNFRKVDEELQEELEEVLIMSDVGVETSLKIIDNLRTRIKREKIEDEEGVKKALRENGISIGKTENPFKIEWIEKANTLDQEVLFNSIQKYRVLRYKDARTWKTHGKGWMKRVNGITYK